MIKTSITILAIALLAAASVAAQSNPKPVDSRKAMDTLDKAFGVKPDGLELAEREYRICMVDNSTKLIQNKIDSAPLLATVASEMCSNDLNIIYSFESERLGKANGLAATQKVRQILVDEMTSFIVKKRAGISV